MGSVLGGGGGKLSSSNVSGYAALPPQLQEIFNQLGEQIGKYTNPSNPGVINAFTPLQQTADETAAFDKYRQGFTPTAQSISSDIAMQQNPFDQYVIDGINREATGRNSILGQNLTRAGQFGSNRGMLGANDIDLSRLQQIGQFKQGQFNTALNNAINVLPGQRQQDAQNLLGIGNFQRTLQGQTNLAPVSALQAGTGMISPFTAGGTQNSTQSSGGAGMLGGFGNLLGGFGNFGSAAGLFGKGSGIESAIASSIAANPAIFSDIRLKTNVKPVGEKNGHKLYEFSYIPQMKRKGRFIGVMAQDVLKIHPEAVREVEGFYAVDYGALGLEMQEVA